MHPSDRPTVGGAMAPAIRVNRLCKKYGRRTAVTDVTFDVLPGQVCALLGPNGAGKTSTLRILVGLSRPDQGSAHILGEPVTLGAGILARVGVLIDGPAFVPHLTGLRNLRLLWSATGQAWPPPALGDALDLAGLGNDIDRKVKGYSMGMKQRLMLAQALMRQPSVLILDEPANGLDPAEVRALRECLTNLAHGGAAVMVSSHQLAEVQQLATHAVVMNRGRLITSGALSDLLGETSSYRFDVDDPARAASLLRGQRGVTAVTVKDGGISVSGTNVAPRDVIGALVAGGIGVASAHQSHRTLEEAFLTITEGDNDHAAG